MFTPETLRGQAAVCENHFSFTLSLRTLHSMHPDPRPSPDARAIRAPHALPSEGGATASGQALGADSRATPLVTEVEAAQGTTAPDPESAIPDSALGLAVDVAGLLHLGPDAAARLARIGRRYEQSVAPATLRALRTDVRRWTTWCRAQSPRRLPLPARPEDLAAFVDTHAERWTPATLRRCLASLARVHRVLALADPTKDEEVRVAMKGAARRRAEVGRGRQRQAAGLTAPVCEALLATLGDRPIDRRDRALLLVARDLLARRSELAALRVEDLKPADDGGATVLIARSKTDQAGQGTYLYLGPVTWAAVQDWLAVVRTTTGAPDGSALTGPLFRAVHVTGRVGGAMHPTNIHDRLKALARRAAPRLRRLGVDPERLSGHSARVGMAQDLVAAGFDLAAIMQAGRWKSSAMVARYTERLRVAQGAIAQYHAAGAGRRTGGPR